MKKHSVWISAFLLLAGPFFLIFFHIQQDSFSFVWMPEEESGDRSVIKDIQYSFFLHMNQKVWQVQGNEERAAVRSAADTAHKKEVTLNYRYRVEEEDILSVEKTEDMEGGSCLARLSRLHIDAMIDEWKDGESTEKIVKRDVCVLESKSSEAPILATVAPLEDGTYSFLYLNHADGDTSGMPSRDFPAVSQNRNVLSCMDKSYLLLGVPPQELAFASSRIMEKEKVHGIYQMDQKGALSAFYEGKQGEYILSADADEEGVCILLWRDGGARLALFDNEGNLLQERSIDLQKENSVYGVRLSGKHVLLGVMGSMQDHVYSYHREALTEEKRISISKGHAAVALQEVMDGKQEVCYQEGRLYLAQGSANSLNVRWYLMVYDENGMIYRGVLQAELMRPYRYAQNMEDIQDIELARMMNGRAAIEFSENKLSFSQ